ncbi:MAG: ATP-dependent DNA helicase RecG [Vulcanibacillus sp.]
MQNINIEQKIEILIKITQRKIKILNEMGLYTIKDLFEYYPYRYENYQPVLITNAKHGEKITVEGEISATPYMKNITNKKNILSVKVLVDNQLITATWFNRSYLKNQLMMGRPILLTGKWDKNRLQITVSDSEFLDNSIFSKKGSIMPVYSITSGLYQNDFRKLIKNALLQHYGSIDDYLPEEIKEKYKLYSLNEAIRAIHFPESYEDVKHARRRIVYDEFLLYQLRIQMIKKSNREKWNGIIKEIDESKLAKLIETLPYELTNDQTKVLNEILADMKTEEAMNRLLQGDVGSGKTIIAIISLYANYLAGYQGAMMVPTEILAEQHEESIREILAPLGVEIALLTGKLTGNNKRSILGHLQMGLIDIVIGTHALIQEGVFFKNLGLVITDEQHRFGVEQRAELRKKGDDRTPDVLFMSATPIPRTLAITAYGDMDVSTIKEYPKGRTVINTYWVKHDAFPRVLDFIKKQVELGRQAYIICPLIEESEKIDVQNAVEIYEKLTELFPQFKVGLMHGKLPSKEKEHVAEKFKNNQVQILVSTTVIEVGVNIINATLMVIYDADRFGLAQLHQLRGRVGRGIEQSYCILLANPKSDISKERIRVMLENNDGFEIARMDLKLRGPGDLLGIKQSGLPDFKLADLVDDYRTLEVARNDAQEWFNNKDFWDDPKWIKLKKEIERIQKVILNS